MQTQQKTLEKSHEKPRPPERVGSVPLSLPFSLSLSPPLSYTSDKSWQTSVSERYEIPSQEAVGIVTARARSGSRAI